MTTPYWEEIDHTADWALRVRGEDYRALFEHAALGMMSLLGSPQPTEITLRKGIQLTAVDLETLLVDWLSELLCRVEEGMVFGEIRVKRVEGSTLEADISAGPSAEPLSKQIKAVTYHMLQIRPNDTGYVTVIVFDV